MGKFRPVQLSLPYDGSVRDLVERAEWLEFVFPFTVRTIDANGTEIIEHVCTKRGRQKEAKITRRELTDEYFNFPLRLVLTSKDKQALEAQLENSAIQLFFKFTLIERCKCFENLTRSRID